MVKTKLNNHPKPTAVSGANPRPLQQDKQPPRIAHALFIAHEDCSGNCPACLEWEDLEKRAAGVVERAGIEPSDEPLSDGWFFLQDAAVDLAAHDIEAAADQIGITLAFNGRPVFPLENDGRFILPWTNVSPRVLAAILCARLIGLDEQGTERFIAERLLTPSPFRDFARRSTDVVEGQDSPVPAGRPRPAKSSRKSKHT